MLYEQDNVIKVGGIVFPGQVTNIEISMSASIDSIQDDKGQSKADQPTGYESAKISIDLYLEDTETATTLDQMQDLQRLFKPYGQKKAKLLKVVNEDCSVRGISKVYFESLDTKHVISESSRTVTVGLLAPKISGIKTKKTGATSTSVTAAASSKSTKSTAGSPANAAQSTTAAKAAAAQLTS